MEIYRESKKELLARFSELGWDSKKVNEWLNTPTRHLRGRTPRQCLNPRSIPALMQYVRKWLK